MLNLSVASCPICFQPHHFESVEDGKTELVCPTFGDTFQVEITAVVRPLPVHLFGRQGSFPLPLPVR
jgi:hypothetical protein